MLVDLILITLSIGVVWIGWDIVKQIKKSRKNNGN